MRGMIVALGLAVLGLGIAACSPAAEQAAAEPQPQAVAEVAAALPELVAVRTIGADGKPTLEGWQTTAAPTSKDVLRHSLHIEPRDKAFAGAKTFSSAVRETDAVTAAKKALAAEGFEAGKLLAETKVKQDVLTRLEKGSWATVLMLDGKMSGRPAKFVGFVWYGAWGEPDGKAAAGVSGFAAPEPVFVAMGGYAVPSILFNNAKATPDTKMSVDGAKPPQQQTKEFADLFAWWAGTISLDNAVMSGVAANGIMNGNLGVKSGTGCINMYGCVGGGMPPVMTKPY